MRRFFRSAAFPILIVIVLAFFAQRLIGGAGGPPAPTYKDFVNAVKHQPGSIASVTVQPKTNDVQVTKSNGDTYTTGYPNNTENEFMPLLDNPKKTKTGQYSTDEQTLIGVLKAAQDSTSYSEQTLADIVMYAFLNLRAEAPHRTEAPAGQW